MATNVEAYHSGLGNHAPDNSSETEAAFNRLAFDAVVGDEFDNVEPESTGVAEEAAAFLQGLSSSETEPRVRKEISANRPVGKRERRQQKEVARREQQLQKTKELAEFLQDPADRRRGLISIYGENTVGTMSDADIEAFITEKTGATPTTETRASVETETAPREAARPAGFEDYNIEDLESQVAQDTALEPLRREAGDRLGFGWVKGAGLYANYHVFRAGLAQRREARLGKKTEGMTAQERADYLEGIDKRRRLTAKIGAGAAVVTAAVMMAWHLKNGLDHTAGGGGNGNDINLTGGGGDMGAGDGSGPGHNGVPAGAGGDAWRSEIDPNNPEALKLYNNSDSSFYDFANKEFRGDFGPALQPSDKDGTMPPGFEDWMSRNRHEPNGLGNLISGLGLDGKGDSLADRNAFADYLDSNLAEHQRYDIMVQEALRDPNQFELTTIDIDFIYDSTYMVDGNGDPVIGTQTQLNYGGKAIQIINKQTGEASLWRTNCGAYQQIWRSEAPAPSGGSSQAATGGGAAPRANNPQDGLVGNRPNGGTGGGNPSTPGNPGTPGQPGNPEGPGGPGTPGTPGEENPTPEEGKKWDGGVDVADGIDPDLNGRVGLTPDPLLAGNGTGSPNLGTGTLPGGESSSPAEGIDPNALSQLPDIQPGADAGWAPSGGVGAAEQAIIDRAAAETDNQMGLDGAVADALDRAIAGMGADGRPLGTGGSGLGAGSGGAGGAGTGLGAGSGFSFNTGGGSGDSFPWSRSSSGN